MSQKLYTEELLRACLLEELLRLEELEETLENRRVEAAAMLTSGRLEEGQLAGIHRVLQRTLEALSEIRRACGGIRIFLAQLEW